MTEIKKKYRKSGLYVKPKTELTDGRTQQARIIRDLRLELVRHIGGNPSPAQELLIQRIVYKHLRLASYENAFVTSQSPEEQQHYIPMSNSLRRDLETLTLLASPDASKPDLKAYIETFSSKKGDKQ